MLGRLDSEYEISKQFLLLELCRLERLIEGLEAEQKTAERRALINRLLLAPMMTGLFFGRQTIDAPLPLSNVSQSPTPLQTQLTAPAPAPDDPPPSGPQTMTIDPDDKQPHRTLKVAKKNNLHFFVDTFEQPPEDKQKPVHRVSTIAKKNNIAFFVDADMPTAPAKKEIVKTGKIYSFKDPAPPAEHRGPASNRR